MVLEAATHVIPTITANISTKKSLQNKCFGAIHPAKNYKTSLYNVNSLVCFLAKRDTPVAVTLQRKSRGGMKFVKKIQYLLENKMFQAIVCKKVRPGWYTMVQDTPMCGSCIRFVVSPDASPATCFKQRRRHHHHHSSSRHCSCNIVELHVVVLPCQGAPSIV